MQLVVLDTNAAMLPFTDGTDLEDELEGLLGSVQMVVPTAVVLELQQLALGQSHTGRAAQAALVLTRDLRAEHSVLAGDDGVLDVARRLGAVVLSNDKRLRNEAKKSGLTVVQSRGHGRLHVA